MGLAPGTAGGHLIDMRKITAGLAVLHKMLLASTFIALQVCAQPAWATLGGDAASVGTGQAHLLASVRVQKAETYTLHELVSKTGTKIHEYLGHDGKVFAVSWQGPFRPNLRQLLGVYYQTYLNAPRSRLAHGATNIQVPGLVINMSGHQRAFYGRAYIPDRVPQGLSTDDIR